MDWGGDEGEMKERSRQAVAADGGYRLPDECTLFTVTVKEFVVPVPAISQWGSLLLDSRQDSRRPGVAGQDQRHPLTATAPSIEGTREPRPLHIIAADIVRSRTLGCLILEIPAKLATSKFPTEVCGFCFLASCQETRFRFPPHRRSLCGIA